MLQPRRGLAGTAVVAGLALVAAACGGSSKPGATTSTGTGSQGTPVKGGTLNVLGAGDVDHLDTASAYYTVSWGLMRTFTRQLVTYPNSSDPKRANTIVADAATDTGKVSDGGKTYTFTLRDGVKWHLPGGTARPVTSQDFKLGFKRLCNPVQPTGAPGYFTATIDGMKSYCDAFGKIKSQSAAGIKQFIDTHDVSGITTPDSKTIVFHLTQPAGDFLNILALPFSSAAPVEYLNYVPDDPQFRTHTISDGPYYITQYVANKSIKLTRNPDWSKSSDPVRGGYVDNINITEGSDEQPVQQQIEAGTVDVEFDTGVPTSRVPALKATGDKKLTFNETGSTNYVVMNLQSPNAGGALKKLKVRQAINYAVDKQNMIQVAGGASVASPLGQIITPPIVGYKKFDPYSTQNSAGDVTKAKKMLAEAGYPNGLTLKFVYRTKGKAPLYATTLQADLAKAGIKLTLIPSTPSDFYTKYLQHPASTRAGVWDLAFPGWYPDWQGNGARSFFVPLLDGRNYGEGSTDYGDYNNPAVNTLIDKALAANVDKAADIWHQADQLVMADAPWVPVFTNKAVNYHSTRTKGWNYFPFSEGPDYTNVWVQ